MRTTVLVKWLNGTAVMAIWIASTIFAPAHAQQGDGKFSTYQLFPDAESPDPKSDVIRRLADAIRKAQPPAPCALGRLKIRTPKGDELLQRALANARESGVLRDLNGLGVPVAGRLFVESTVSGGGGGHDTVFEAPLDRKPPKLTTTSVPRKGSKVMPGDRIRVTMVVRDDPAPWPTGIKTIQLVADSENGRFVASENFAPCAEPAERRVEATYTVPQNPPPIVRLTALAEDHARHMDTDVGEFPTGDWYGEVDMQYEGSGHKHKAKVTYSFSVKPNGVISGMGRARIVSEEQQIPNCTMLVSVSPNEFDVPIFGRQNNKEFELRLSTAGQSTITTKLRCPGGPTPQHPTQIPFNGLLTFIGHNFPDQTPTHWHIRVPARDGATDTVKRRGEVWPKGWIYTRTIQLRAAR